MVFRDCYFDGVKVRQGKSQVYADIFLRAKLPNGQADMEQMKFRTFNEEVIKICRTLNAGDIVNIDLQIKDAFVQSIENPYDLAVEL